MLLRWLALSLGIATLPAPAMNPLQPRAPVSRAEFRSLLWLGGRWKGTGGGLAAFYEEYRVLNDSTIEQFEHPDSTFSATRPRSVITWRNGVTAKGLGDRVEARITRLVGDTVRFEFTRPGGGGFTWIRVSDTEWKAVLDGRNGPVVYVLTRVPRR